MNTRSDSSTKGGKRATCKFIPVADDQAGMALRKIKDRHNERESKRRARKALSLVLTLSDATLAASTPADMENSQ